MSKTKAQLEEENDALRALVAAIGEGLPPLPEDPEKMNLYGLECASRLSQATAYAAGVADCREDFAAAYAQQTASDLRGRWARPLHYDAELPDRSACACGHAGTEHIYTAPSPCTQCDCKAFSAAVPDEDATAGLCQYCDVEPAIAGNYCEACAPAVQLATGTPVIVEDDGPPPVEWTRRFGPYCTATTVRGTVTYYCDRAPHSGGAHRSPGWCEDDPDITWTDEGPHCGAKWPNLGPAGDMWTCTLDRDHDGDHEAHVTGGRLAHDASAVIPQGHPDIVTNDAPDLLDALLAAGYKVTYSEDKAVGGWWANLIRPDGTFAENGLGETQEQALAQLRERVARQGAQA